MLSSLFGDDRAPPEDERWRTTLPEGEGQPLIVAAPAPPEAPRERRLEELFLTGSPADALRAHLAAQGEPPLDAHAIVVFDPVRVWAPALFKSLSDAGGQPIERLQLRDAVSRNVLATVERTRVVQRNDETLRLYHADVPSGVGDSAAVPLALMERAQLAAVIVGPMHPESIAGMLERVLAATHEPTWRCPYLLFMLPPAAVWIANRTTTLGWPQPLHVTVLNESLTSASAVWSALAGIWNRARTLPPWAPPAPARAPGEETLETIHVEPREPEALVPIALDLPPDEPGADATEPRPLPRPLQVSAALLGLLASEGVLGCALVEARSGTLLGRELRQHVDLDIDAAGAAGAQLMRAHRLAAGRCGLAEPVDEVITSAGTRQHLVRRLSRQPGLLLCAVLDTTRSNLAQARYKLVQAEQALA